MLHTESPSIVIGALLQPRLFRWAFPITVAQSQRDQTQVAGGAFRSLCQQQTFSCCCGGGCVQATLPPQVKLDYRIRSCRQIPYKRPRVVSTSAGQGLKERPIQNLKMNTQVVLVLCLIAVALGLKLVAVH